MGKGSTAANVFDNHVTAAPSGETLEQKIARLEAENAKLKASAKGFTIGRITMAIGDGHEWTNPKTKEVSTTKKGNVLFYGFQKGFPLSFWPNQLEKLMKVLSGAEKIGLKGSDGEFTFPQLYAMAKEKGLLSYKTETTTDDDND